MLKQYGIMVLDIIRSRNVGRFHFWLLTATQTKFCCVRRTAEVKNISCLNYYVKPSIFLNIRNR